MAEVIAGMAFSILLYFIVILAAGYNCFSEFGLFSQLGLRRGGPRLSGDLGSLHACQYDGRSW